MVRLLIPQLIAAASLFTGVATYAQAPEKVISDQILPKDTYLYVSVPNVSELKNFVSNSSIGQLWNDPELDAFKDEVLRAFGAEFEERLMKVKDTLGMSLEDLLSIPQGEVSLAVTATGRSMGAVIFLDFGSNEDQVRSLLDQAAEQLAQVPRLTSETRSFEGTEVVLYNVQHQGPSPTPLAEEFGWFIKDERLIVSNQSELLEYILSNWDGEGTESFTTNDSYAYIMSRCEANDRSALSTMYFDPIGLFNKLVQTGSLGPQATMMASMGLGFIPQLGLNQMRAVGSVSKPGSGDFEAVTRSVFYADQPPQGLMQIFQLDSIDTAPPEWVKDNATAYLALKWKISEAYSAVENLADMFAGPGYLASKVQELSTRDPGIHIKLDIVDQLTGEFQFVTAPGDTDSIGGDQIVLALGVRDTESAGSVLAKIADQAGMEPREFRGVRVYDIPVPAEAGQSMALTIAEGKLLFGIGTTLLEQVLRNDNDMRPLADSEDYRRVAQHFPRTALSVQFNRPAEQYRSFYELLRSGEATEQFPGSQDFFEQIDFTTLPDFDVIAKYIHPAGGYTTEDENGYFMEAFQLKD